jgi:contactin associated protein-like 2
MLDISTGPYYMIGGGIYGQKGFVGCMRHITIDGNYKLPGMILDKLPWVPTNLT